MKLLKKVLTTTLALALMTSTVFAGNNRIKINSKNSDGVDLKGFEYTIESDKLEKPVKVDFENNTEFVLDNLEDGTYHIKETKTVKGYEKSKDHTVELPTKDGHTSVKITPKHMKKQIKDDKGYTNTGTSLSIVTISLGILLLVALFMVFLPKKSDIKEQK